MNKTVQIHDELSNIKKSNVISPQKRTANIIVLAPSPRNTADNTRLFHAIIFGSGT